MDNKGMQFDQHLTELYNEGKISLNTAKSASNNPSDFECSLYISNKDLTAPLKI